MSATTLPKSGPGQPTAVADSRGIRPNRPGIVLVTLLTCQLMIVLDATVMNVALPRIQTDLHFSATSLSWVMTAYTLVYGGLLLLGGRTGDLMGRRRLLIAGVALFSVGSLAGGLAPSPSWLIIARIVQALGAVMAGPSTLALLTTTFHEPRARIRALAWFSGMSSAGFAVGLVLGGLLTGWFGWRSVMFINVPFGVAVLVSSWLYLNEPQRHPARLDIPGAVAATAGIASLVYGFTNAAAHGWATGSTLLWLGVGAVLIPAFGAIETHVASPLLPLRLFGNRNRAAAYACMFLGPMAGMSMFFFMTQYLQEVRGMNALTTGFAFLPTAVVVFCVSRLVPRLLARFGAKPPAMVGTACFVATMVVLTQLSTASDYFPRIFLSFALMGLGMGLAFAPLNVIIMGSVAASDAGAAGGALQTMQQTGASLGIAILVTVFGNTVRGAHGPAHQVMVNGMTTAFMVSACIAALAFLVSLTFPGKQVAAVG